MRWLWLIALAACGGGGGLRTESYRSGACTVEAPAGWKPGPLNVPWQECLFELRPPEEQGHAVLLMVDEAGADDADLTPHIRGIFVLEGPGAASPAVDEPMRTVGEAQCIVRRRPGTKHGHAVEVACIDRRTGGGAHLRATEPWAADHDILAITARAASSYTR